MTKLTDDKIFIFKQLYILIYKRFMYNNYLFRQLIHDWNSIYGQYFIPILFIIISGVFFMVPSMILNNGKAYIIIYF